MLYKQRVQPQRRTDADTPRPPQDRRAGEVVLFVLVATALCAVAAMPALLGWLPSEMSGVVVPFAQLTPLLTALAFWAVIRPGRLRSMFALGWSWRGVLAGVAAVALVSALQLLLGLVMGWQVRGGDLVVQAAIAVLPVLAVQAVFAIGEEFGWRGWLASRTAHWPFAVAAAVTALAWVIWHLPALPLVLAGGGWSAGAAYLAAIASWAPFLLALRRWTGSVWPAVVAHGALNSIRVFFLQSVADSGGVDWAVEALGWVLWIGAAVLLNARNSATNGRVRHSA